MSIDVDFALNVVLLVLLAATVYYAARLSYFMSHFRQGRNDMAKLLADLSRQVAQAENAMSGMRGVAEKAGAQLQNMINEARFLSDELRFMNESGDNLAGRLEKLAERNRELVDLLEGAGGIGTASDASSAPRPRPVVQPPSFLMTEKAEMPKPAPVQTASSPASASVASAGGFSIRDKEFDNDLLGDLQAEDEEDDFVFAQGGGFSSQAEKDLYEALQRGRPVTRTSNKIR